MPWLMRNLKTSGVHCLDGTQQEEDNTRDLVRGIFISFDSAEEGKKAVAKEKDPAVSKFGSHWYPETFKSSTSHIPSKGMIM